MICEFCKKEITGERGYVSKQATMEGTYHWACFIEACKKTRKQSLDSPDSPAFGGDVELPFTDLGNSASS
jgi:hypothetical protein